jgi:hypothetical protein
VLNDPRIGFYHTQPGRLPKLYHDYIIMMIMMVIIVMIMIVFIVTIIIIIIIMTILIIFRPDAAKNRQTDGSVFVVWSSE